MRALAEVLLGREWQLSGSDLDITSAQYLAKAGVELCRSHAAESISKDVRLVIRSDAIGPNNPELRRAAELGIPVRSYFDMAGRLMAGKHGLAVAGTHGKSTTTAMAAQILQDAGNDPTVLCGATPIGSSSGGRAGRGEIVLVEACEYRANFLRLRPRQAVLLGIEPDHFDCYPTESHLERAFSRFARSIPRSGRILARYGCAATRRVTAGLSCSVATFGFDRRADWSARNLTLSAAPQQRGRYAFEIHHLGRHFGHVELQVPGRHNVINALAAAALVSQNGVPADRIVHSLGRFRGLYRRLETLGTRRGVLMLDDYAHHPTEIEAALDAIRHMAPLRRLWCVFQPHQVSRTEHLLAELAAALHNADKLLVAEIFRAREPAARDGDLSARDLAQEVRRLGGEVSPVHTTREIVEVLLTQLTPADVLVTMGAGDIRKVYDRLIEQAAWSKAAS